MSIESTKDEQRDSVAVHRLVRQVECLTEAVASLAYCLQRGPCWGATGEVNNALQKAWRLVEQARSNPPNAKDEGLRTLAADNTTKPL